MRQVGWIVDPEVSRNWRETQNHWGPAGSKMARLDGPPRAASKKLFACVLLLNKVASAAVTRKKPPPKLKAAVLE